MLILYIYFTLGDFLLVGVMQPVIRMYDITTSQCFVASNPAHQHSDSVTSIKWSPDGKLYASASIDGMIKIWDGVSSSCISTFPRAHDGAPVCSVQFARNGKSRILLKIQGLTKVKQENICSTCWLYLSFISQENMFCLLEKTLWLSCGKCQQQDVWLLILEPEQLENR